MKRKAIILLAAVMLIGTMLTGCGDKDKNNKNAPTQQLSPQQQQQHRDQRNQQRDQLNPNPVDRINPDGTRG